MKFKISIVGDYQSGKTSFTCRLTDDCFVDKKSTVAANFYLHKIQLTNKPPIELQIWDTGGDKRYSSLLSMYLRDCYGVIIVLDPRRDKDDNSKLLMDYLNALKQPAKRNVSITITLSRNDLTEVKTTEEDIHQFLDDKKLKQKFSIISVTTHSAKTGDNVKEIAELMAKMCFCNELPDVNDVDAMLIYCFWLNEFEKTHQALADNIMTNLKKLADENNQVATVILQLTEAKSNDSYFLSFYQYLQSLNLDNDSEGLDQIYWDIGNGLYINEHYAEAVTLLTKIPFNSQHYQDAYMISQACQRSAKGYKHFKVEDLKPNPDLEPAAQTIQAIFKAKKCTFFYKQYQQLRQSIDDHLKHGRVDKAKQDIDKLEQSASYLKLQ